MPQSTHHPAVVYKYYDECGILIYVGITARGHKRAVEHATTKDWWQFVRSQEVEHHSSPLLAAEREADLIRRHRPPFNVVHNPDHGDALTTYMAVRPDLVGADMDPVSALQHFGREWPVAVCDRHGARANLVVGPKLWPATRHLARWKGEPRIISPTQRPCGSVTDATHVGGSLWLAARINKKVEATKGIACVKFDPNLQDVVLKHVRLLDGEGGSLT